MDPHIRKIEQELDRKLFVYIANKIRPSKSRDRNNAHDVGVDCDTYQAACRLSGHLRPKKTVSLTKLFRIGNEWEDLNFSYLKKAEIPIRQAAQDFIWKEYQISGRLDGVGWIYHQRELKEVEIPVEHKAMSDNIWKLCHSIKQSGGSLSQAEKPWLRKYAAQMQIYMLWKGIDYGLWVFFNDTYGDFFFWIAELDLAYAEECLKRAERCNRNVAKGYIPEAIVKKICRGCDFEFTLCFPRRDYGPGYNFYKSTKEIVDLIVRLKAAEPAHEEYADLYAELIGSRKDPGLFYGNNCVIGMKYQIIAREQKNGFRHEIKILGG